MPSDKKIHGSEGICADVELTPTQRNVVIEDKLSNLAPIMRCTLAAFHRAKELLENGRIDWRKALERAKQRSL